MLIMLVPIQSILKLEKKKTNLHSYHAKFRFCRWQGPAFQGKWKPQYLVPMSLFLGHIRIQKKGIFSRLLESLSGFIPGTLASNTF